MEDMLGKIEDLVQRKEQIKLGGGTAAIEKQHAQGKLTVRERIDLLLDPGTFTELDIFAARQPTVMVWDQKETPSDGIVTGYGKINGRMVSLWAQDFTVMSGAVGETHARKLCKATDLAYEMKIPLIGLMDGAGGRLQEPLAPINVATYFLAKMARNSGVVPQITAILGPVPGMSYTIQLTDFIIMAKETGFQYVTSPRIVKRMTGEDVTHQELGGARIHSQISGCCDLVGADDKACLQQIKDLLSFVPSSCEEYPAIVDTGDKPDRIAADMIELVPTGVNELYDMREVIARIVDTSYFFELKPDFAKNIITCFARLGGRSVGIVASQPMVKAGVIDTDAADKMTRFIRFCDAFNIPLIYLVDTPGVIIGTTEERKGILRHGAKAAYAVAEATVPQIQVCIRKSYAGGYILMGSKALGIDLAFAWPIAEVGFMSSPAAGTTLLRKLDDGQQKEKEKEYSSKLIDIYWVAGRKDTDMIEDIIDPRQTRPILIKALDVTSHKRKSIPNRKHGNMPV